jgi:hypothetical protein
MHLTRSKLAASLGLLALLTLAFVSLLAACNDDDTTTPTYYLGTTDASPPRLGSPDDAGTQ